MNPYPYNTQILSSPFWASGCTSKEQTFYSITDGKSPLQNGSDSSNYRTFLFIGLHVAFSFLSGVLLEEYVKYIDHLLLRDADVSNRTNMKKLRDKHLYSKWNPGRTDGVWKSFGDQWLVMIWVGESPLLPEPEMESTTLIVQIFDIINDVLGGEDWNCANIQRKILRSLKIDSTYMESSSFEATLSKRNIGLFKFARW